MIPTGNDDGINRQYMRYADIVLMRAELENELNGASAAVPYLTKIRNRAFATSDRATFCLAPEQVQFQGSETLVSSVRNFSFLPLKL